MPIVAIGAAALAWAGAATAVGALTAGGLAALTLTGALEITAAIGATLGAVGVVTRDKGLMKAGLIIGGIGGIGALAANAGLLGSEAGTASLFGDSSAVAADAALPAGAMSAEGFPELAASGSDASASIVDTLGNTDVAKALPSTGIEQQATGTGLINSNAAAGTGIAESASPAASDAATSVAAAMPKEVSTSLLNPWTAEAPVAPAAPSTFGADLAAAGAVPAAPSVESPGVLGGLADFAGKNPVVAYGMIQAGGSLVSGLFNPVTPAQVAALDATAAANRASGNYTANQVKNLGQPIPVARRISPITGQPIGLINTQPNANTVTGVPA